MSKKLIHSTIIFFLFTFLISSCSKGYEIRFANYYTEKMDTVIIGKNKIIFSNIDKLTSTDYQSIARGQYDAVCISSTKQKFYTSFFIPGKGSGKRTIQIDGTKTINVLEE